MTAEEPVKCLKLVRKYVGADGNPEYRSYFEYNDVEYRIGETFKDRNPFTCSSFGNNIESGLHTFSPGRNGARTMYDWAVQRRDYFRKKEKSASPSEKGFYRNAAYDVALLECRIPAGARYYEGQCTCLTYFGEEELDQTGYVSDMLTPVRELSPDEIAQMPYVIVCYELTY